MLKSSLKFTTINNTRALNAVCYHTVFPYSIHSPIPLDLCYPNEAATIHMCVFKFQYKLTKIKVKKILFPAELAIFQVPNHHVVRAATQLK